MIRNLIIGKNNFIESHGEYKQAMLSGQFALVAILLSLFYIALDIVSGTISNIPVFSSAILLMIFSLFSHRRGNHCLANYFLLPTINILLYLMASSESSNTGTFMFFIVNATAAFAVFSYSQRLLSILFAIFTYVLFVLAYFVDFSILPKRVYDSDKSRLQVIIGNLLSNAVRYHDTRKQEQYIRLQYQSNGSVFSIKVEDNGQGISKEYHSRIFDMFYRANEMSKGSGLGLYIVKEALMKLSGSIQLDSTPGIGTIITVRLPNRQY